jgi:biopolymer transport protein ExbB
VLDSEAVLTVRAFLETGGDILVLIGIVTLLMWTLILERFWYFTRLYPAEVQAVLREWNERRDRSSWNAHQIRRLLISQVSLRMDSGLTLIRTLVAVCPLLGLLGTVTGMIEVFDVMAMVGSGNARAMASGVYMATIPTMAGMVAALSGVYFIARLERLARRRIVKVKDTLSMERGEVCAVG